LEEFPVIYSFHHNSLAPIEMKILFLNPVRVLNPDRIEKDCNE